MLCFYSFKSNITFVFELKKRAYHEADYFGGVIGS